MAAVYRVRDEKTGARLALKRSWAGDPGRARKRSALLEREFHMLAQLRHPRIIEVYDFGVDADGPYYTMELLDGADLDKTGRLPWREACSLLRDIASSLAILHSRGLLHRDVSSRNVRRTADGRAKLIDFGTMVSIGSAYDVVGTPQFMPPEVLQMQALDARADLFSLGTLGYYVLTGRHAYPASRPSELRDAWRSRPASPSRSFPDVPAALSALILQLISLDRGARPQAAAEVMERLCAIADLPAEELPEISRAYLTTPSLVGRDKALTSVRGRMLSLVRGDGGAILIEGPAGSGRSRMIDACVFEGKLLGATVVRAHVDAANGGAWGVARALCSELFSAMPEAAIEASRLARGVLEHVIDELRRDGLGTMSMTFPERGVILRELRDFVLALGRHQRLLLVVDDADRIDEPSAAFFASLADKTERQSLMLVLAMEPENDETRSGPQHLLRVLAHVVALEPLDREQTEALLRSVFGDVPNLQLCAGRIHALAEGSPRTVMELAQHLVDRKLARYEAGRWRLPARLDESDLPKTLSESLAHRIRELPEDARELAEILAVADEQPLSLATCRTLTRHADMSRLYQALEELVSARIVLAGAEYPQFSQRGFVPVIVAGLSDARSRELHAKLADVLASQGGDVLVRARHLLRGGRERQGLTLLCSLDLQARPPPLELLEQAVEQAVAQADALPARALHRLRMALLSQASLFLAEGSFRSCLPHVLRRLREDSGLSLYDELGHLPPEQRLSEALVRQQQRYLQTPEREQVYGVGDAVRELARLSGAACSMAGSIIDPTLLDALPSLEPLLPLTPALRVVSQLVEATREMMSGHGERALALWTQALERIDEPDRAGLDGPQLERTRGGLQYALGLFEAHLGLERAEERAKYLESQRTLRVAAFRVRSLLYLQRGNAEAAARASRRAEVLQLQDESTTHYSGTDTMFQLAALNLSGDLLGVKSALDSMQSMAASHQGWVPFLPYAQSCYFSLLGDHEAALDVIAPVCERLQPGVDPAFAPSAVQHVRAMRERGVTLEALEMTKRYLELFQQHELTTSERHLWLEASLTLAAARDYDRAIPMIETALRGREQDGSTGLVLGVFYEARARIAAWMGDRAGFERFAALCAQEYAKGHNPVLNARYAQLVEEARQHQLGEIVTRAYEHMRSLAPEMNEREYEALHSRILECVDAPDRARCALTMLLQSTDSYLGYLYGVRDSGVVALASLPEASAEPELDAWLSSWVREERNRAISALTVATITSSEDAADARLETVTGTMDVGSPSLPPSFFTDREGRTFFASVLVAAAEGQRTLAAVLAVQVTGPRTPIPPASLRAEIASQLLSHGDVTGVSLELPATAPAVD